jgi:hypothetical protein
VYFAIIFRKASSTLSLHNKLTLNKLIIRPTLTYAGPVWNNTSQSNYRHLQILQSKCLRVIGDYPRRTPILHLHSTLSLEFIRTFIYRLTKKFFSELYYTLQSSHLPNRKLLSNRSPRTVQEIHTQTDQTSSIVDLTLQLQCFLHCTYFSLLQSLCILPHPYEKNPSILL